jgi:hypothetical protein
MAIPEPSIIDIEPNSVTVQADHDTGGVQLEVVDRDGNGFRTIFDQLVVLDIVVGCINALAKLRGYGSVP